MKKLELQPFHTLEHDDRRRVLLHEASIICKRLGDRNPEMWEGISPDLVGKFLELSVAQSNTADREVLMKWVIRGVKKESMHVAVSTRYPSIDLQEFEKTFPLVSQ